MTITPPRKPQLFLAFGLLFGLSACATPSEPTLMVVAATQAATTYPPPLRHAMCLRTVTGGEETNPLWVSKVDSQDFKAALTGSMDNAGLIAGQTGCQYPTDVNVLGLSQPAIGLDMTVTSHVNYKVYDPAGAPILLETISAPFTATFSDSPIGFVRVKRANEGSIRANITQFLDKLAAWKRP